MCGICGIIEKGPVDKELLARMTGRLVHRGPDDMGLFTDGRVGMGVRRLSVIDIEGGRQPYESEDGRFAMVYNGEVYNHQALRSDLEGDGHRFRSKCDGEAALHALEDGDDNVNRFRGVFAFALWDRRDKRLLLGRDRLGVKPLYYYFHGDMFAFASEIKALLEVPHIRRDLAPDLRALAQIMTYNFPLGARTAFRNINELPPGHLLAWENGRVRMKQYWDIDIPAMSDARGEGDEERVAEELIALLEESVRIRLMSDVELGTCLSGGLDSSIITALARRRYGPGLKTFSLGFDVPLWDESEKACEAAAHIDTVHRKIPCAAGLEMMPKALESLEQPQRWSGTAGLLQLYRAASADVKVLLTGEGADEIFGGYPHLTEFPLKARRSPESHPFVLYFNGLSHLDEERRRRLFASPLLEETDDGPCGPVSSRDFQVNSDRIAGRDPFNKGLYLDLKLRMVKFVVFMLDRLSMAFGVEARAPFLDHEFVEMAMKIPPSMKVRPPYSKYILRRAAEGLLPESILESPKQGFVEPADQWMRGILPRSMERALSPDVTREKGYFNPQTVSSMLETHRAGKERHGYDLVGVAMLHLWDDLFIAGKSREEVENP